MFRNLDFANSHAQLDKTLDKTMSEEQFNQIVEAILSGKYSWACLLILRFSGYNPLHYIPYRTYNRLMKVNRTSSTPAAAGKYSNQLEDEDVGYLEEIDCQSDQIKGGRGVDSLAMLRGMIWSGFNF